MKAAKPPKLGSRSLEGRIYAIYGSLSPAEKRLADVLLHFQMELPSYTAGELAAKADVSKSTAARLIRALGYESYPEAKRQIRTDQHWGSPRADLDDAEKTSAQLVSLNAMVETDLNNIRATAAGISEKQFNDVADAISHANRIWVLGLRSGYGLAHQAAHYLSLARTDVQMLQLGGASIARDIGAIAKGDVLLVVAFRRRPRLLTTILNEVRRAGGITVLVTDLSAAETAKQSDHVLYCRCQSPSPFNSFVAAVTVINFVAWRVTALLGDKSFAHFARIDHLVNLLDDVVTPLSPAFGSSRDSDGTKNASGKSRANSQSPSRR